MVEVVVDSVRVNLMSPQRVVILRQTDAERYLPIWVGPYEAEAITVALQEIEMSRPLTHDLLRNVFQLFGGKLVRVEIVALRDDIFFGSLIVEADGKTLQIDSRPSDAIALAVRAHVPILVDPEVMREASIVPETDLEPQDAPLAATDEPLPPAQEADKGRLSVFEDFLDKLEPPSSPPEQDTPPDPT